MPAWLEVKRSKVVYFSTLYDSINEMKHFRYCLYHTSTVPQPFLLLIAANFALAGLFWLKIEHMVCAGLVGGTTEQSCIFLVLI